MAGEEDREKIVRFIGSEFLEGSTDGLTEDTPLIKLGIIDSLTIAKTISFIEKEFFVKIEGEDMVPENFENIKNVLRLIESKRENKRTKS